MGRGQGKRLHVGEGIHGTCQTVISDPRDCFLKMLFTHDCERKTRLNFITQVSVSFICVICNRSQAF